MSSADLPSPAPASEREARNSGARPTSTGDERGAQRVDDESADAGADLPATAMPRARPGQPGGRRDTNRRERVKAISDAAVTLFLAQGIESTTIDDITKHAGVSKGSFYRYFEGKDELVDFVLQPVVSEVSTAFDRCSEGLARADDEASMMAVYQELGTDLSSTTLHHSEIVLLYLQESRAPGVGARKAVRALYDLISSRTLDLTRLAHERKLLRPFPPHVSALGVIGAVERIAYAVLTEESVGDIWEIPDALASMILDGLVAPKLKAQRAE